MGSVVSYVIDADDRVVEVGPGWDAFVSANDGDGIVAFKVIGQSLWPFIGNPATRHLHQVLLARARAAGPVPVLPFRCDSPALRRFLLMDIVPLTGGRVEYRCRILRVEDRPPVPLQAAPPDAATFLAMCSWCKRVDRGSGEWQEIEAAIAGLGLFGTQAPPPISHGMCQDCLHLLVDQHA